MQLIIDWLNGNKNYYIGISLYKTFGKDEALKKVFALGHSSHRQQLLENELEALTKTKKTIPIVENKETALMPDSSDLVLIGLKNEWMPLYLRMNYLRQTLDNYKGNSKESIEARKPIAFEILDIEQQVMAIWAKADYYKEHGCLPSIKKVKTIEEKDPIKLAAKIENLKKYIRRTKLQMQGNKNPAKYAEKHKEYLEQYFLITNTQYYEQKD
jgi:hypothetical protein